MKRTLAILLSILSLLFFLNTEENRASVSDISTSKEFAFDCSEQTFSQYANFIDFNGYRGSLPTISLFKPSAKNGTSKRSLLDFLSGVKFAIANLYSCSSYSYSCNFPFEHQPQKGLIFILHNIRV